ncbi:MAG: Inositol 2-dehydrogenase/D-chiro-inositol 3-dehydrogenase [Lentisphaerae bacterium ADurb.Bin242]|nr:MAG: Inositol 2-dehydrogenase/D-chiro-inositol 3-dehydrogenase [Lentisphaerae bacterium ADurb.Bin242]
MVKFGIIGAGRMGNTHASYLGTFDGAKIAAVYDPKPEAAQAMHDKYGAEICAGPEEVAAAADCVVVSSPTYCHQDGIRAAIGAGKVLFCEKPLCRDFTLADEMLQLGRNYSKLFAIGFVRRHMFKTIKFKELLEQNFLGKLHFCNVDLPLGAYKRMPGDWFTDFDKSGGVIIDMLAHHVDLANWFFGPAARVYAQSDMLDPSQPLPADHVASVVTYKNGVICNYMCNWQRFGRSAERMEIYGEKGALVMDGGANLTYYPSGGEKKEIQVGPVKADGAGVEEVNVADGYGCQMLNLFQYMKGGKKVFPTVEDGYNSLMVGKAMIESARTGNVVQM